MPDLIHLWHKGRGIYNRTSIAAPQSLSGKRGRGGEQLAGRLNDPLTWHIGAKENSVRYRSNARCFSDSCEPYSTNNMINVPRLATR
jgi:hypothetical protein